MTKRTVTYGGAKMRVRDLIGDREHTFVMVHGIGVSSRYFEPLAYALHPHGNVLLVDLPGFGGIPRPKKRLSITKFADIVKAGVEAEDITNPIFIGHSMGAQVVTDLLARHDISTDAVLIGPPVNPAEPTLPQQVVRLLESARFESMRLRLIASRGYLLAGPAWFMDVLPSMMRYPMREQLPLVKANTLLLTGQHDAITPRSWAEEIVKLMPQATWREIPGAAHNVVYEHWQPAADLILAHLGEEADASKMREIATEVQEAAAKGEDPPD